VDPRGDRQRRPYRRRSSATARAESCAASWPPACAILMISFATISVRGSSRSLTQRVCNAAGTKSGALGQCHFNFLSGRSISSYVGTWVLSRHDSRAAPQTVQTASPVCGTKNFSSVRLYSAPQLHCTIVAIPGICASDRRFSSPDLCHNRTEATASLMAGLRAMK
jgi:hypothetical protein